TAACCCGNSSHEKVEQPAGGGIRVLGSGCAKCNALEAAVKEAMAELGIEEKIEHVTDFSQIAAYGVMSTPALVVDGKVVSYGKVLKKEEAVKLLRTVRGQG
ncbi:MAG: thioredoxin family protein, partial [Pseudoflavonifractor sp.]|nr:thioredoxin family protein [Pseudoflavonifractor sp.]